MATDYFGWGSKGQRVGLILCSHTGYSSGGGSTDGHDAGKGVNGIFSNNSTGSWFFPGTTVAGKTINWNFQTPVIVTKLKWYQDSSASQGVHQLEGSNDNSSWTPIDSTYTLGSGGTATTEHTFANTVAYQYYRLMGVSGNTNSGPWIQEQEFEMDHGDVEAGDRTATMSASITGLTLGGGSTLPQLFDGAITNAEADSIWLTNAQAVSGSTNIEIDFGTDVSLSAVALLTSGPNGGVWKLQVDVLGTWVDFGSSFTMGANDMEVFVDGPYDTGKIRFLGVSGTTNSSLWINEVLLKTGDTLGPGAGGDGLPVIIIHQ